MHGKDSYKPPKEGLTDKIETTTVMFVPSTAQSRLIGHLEEIEQNIMYKTRWRTKLVEKPGTPLLTQFIRKFPMELGCSRGTKCVICKNKGTLCMTKRVVYMAFCKGM